MKRILMRCPKCSIYGSIILSDTGKRRYVCRSPACDYWAGAEAGWVRLYADMIEWAAVKFGRKA